jgi:hypothetical protein
MFRRPLWLTGMLAAAALLPYLTLDDQVAQFVRGSYERLTGRGQPQEVDPLAILAELEKPRPAAAAPAGSAADLPGSVPLQEALRFDATPEWIASRWPRVTSVADDAALTGLRVPLVSGTEPTDVAGSLTYYFDSQRQVERITLLGVTGDHSRLVALVCGKFGLRPSQTPGAEVYVAGHSSAPASTLRIANLPLGHVATSTARLQLVLDLHRSDVAKVPPAADLPGKILPGNYRRW